MKQYANATMGLDIKLQVPESNEEFDKLAGRANAANDDAVKYNVLHGWNTTFRSKFVEAVEKETGVKRIVDTTATEKQPKKKDGTQTPVYEKDLLYFKRVCAETNREVVTFATLGQTVADSIPLDLSESTGGGRIGKEYKASADDLLAKVTAGTASIERVIGNLERLNPGLKVELNADGVPDSDELARAIKVNADRKKKEALDELSAEE